MISQPATVGRRVKQLKSYPIIGAYLPPSNIYHFSDIDEAINRFPGRDPIVMGDLNAGLGLPENLCNQQVAYFLVYVGLVDLLVHLRQCMQFSHMKTWRKVKQGFFLCSRLYYILGLYHRMFETVGIKVLRNFSSGHFALRARLLRRLIHCHGRYLRGPCTLHLNLPLTGPLKIVETKFQDLKAF